MKKTTTSILLLLSLLLITACTLSMDEWAETEEDKGYDNVETVENDFYKLEYEYKATTRSLTDSIQQFIAKVEDDSIIYFTDNIPPQWLPQPGGCVVANCCEKFPTGLVGRVISVERSAGLVKVVATEAALEEAYEEFNFELDADVFTSDPEEQETDTVYYDDEAPATVRQTFTRAPQEPGGTAEIVTRDWAMFRAIKAGEKQHRSAETRADLSDIYDKDVDDKDTKTGDVIMFEASLDGAFGDFIKEKTKGAINTASIKVSNHTKTTIHKKVELKRKREYTSTTTSNGIKLSALIGHDFAKAKNDAEKEEQFGQVTDMMKKTETFQKYSTKLESKKGSLDIENLEFTVEIPLPSVPFGIILRIKPVLDVKIGLYGNVEVVFWTSRDRTITDVVDGKKIKDDTEKLSKPDNEYAINGFGTFEISGGIEVFLGLGKKFGKKAAGIGAFIEGTLNASLNVSATVVGDNRLGSSNDLFRTYAKGKFGGKILTGGLFGDITFLSKEYELNGFSVSYFPKLSYSSAFPVVTEEDAKGSYDKQTISYHFTNLGLFIPPWLRSRLQPIIAVYKTDPKSNYNFPAAVLTDPKFKKGTKVATGKEYTFTYKNYDVGKEYYIVPGLMDRLNNHTLLREEKTAVQSTRLPNIEYKTYYDDDEKVYDYVYQYYASTPTYGGISTYKVAMPFRLRNASAINDYWSDWGIYFEVDIGGKERKVYKKSLKDAITQSGKYMAKATIYTNKAADEVNIYVSNACIYYCPKGSTVTFKLNGPDERIYMYKGYKIYSAWEGDVYLRRELQLYEGVDDDLRDFRDYEDVKLK